MRNDQSAPSVEYQLYSQRHPLYLKVLDEYWNGNVKHAEQISVDEIVIGDSLFIPHMRVSCGRIIKDDRSGQ